jgi:dihydroxyacetone kinase-like protein
MAGLKVASIVRDDDVALENSTYTTGRRGVAGTLIVKKALGAAAEIGTPATAFKQRRYSSCTPSDASKPDRRRK